MKTRDERMKELENEEFYFISFNGTQMPNDPQYKRIVIFKDVFYIDNEKGSKSYNDVYFISKVEEFISKNLDILENLDKSDSDKIEYPKSSFTNKVHIRINGKTFTIDRNLLTDGKEIKLYDEFVQKVEEILK